MIFYLPKPKLYKVTVLCTDKVLNLIEESHDNMVRFGATCPMLPYTLNYCEVGNLAMTIWASDLCTPNSVYILKAESPTGGIVRDPNEVIEEIANVFKKLGEEKGELFWIMGDEDEFCIYRHQD